MRALAVVVAVVVAAGPAEAALCRRKSGTIFSRPQGCKRNERPIAVETFGAPGAAGAAGAAGAKGGVGLPSLPAIVSADGKVVADWSGEQAIVTSPLDGFPVAVSISQFVAGDVVPSTEILHEDGACQGPPFLGLPGGDSFMVRGIMLARMLAYPVEAVVVRTFASVSKASAAPCPPGTATAIPGVCCQGAQARSGKSAPLRFFDTASLGTRPFGLARETP